MDRVGSMSDEEAGGEFQDSAGAEAILCPNGDHPSAQDQKGDNSPK